MRGRIAVEFYEKKRRRPGMWFGGLAGMTGKGEEEVCWEIWTLDVTIATPRTESGMHLPYLADMIRSGLIKNRTRKSSQSHGEYAPESSLQDPRRRQQG